MKTIRIGAVRARLLPGGSQAEAEHAGEIDAVWRAALARKPRMFNGRILLGERAAVEDGALTVDFRETAFATLVWLRGAGGVDGRLLNVFGAAAVFSRDGAALLGRMAPHTANAGQVYFPCGTPDLGDVDGLKVDIEGSIARELMEETGLAAPIVQPTENRVVVFDGSIAGIFRRFDSDLDAEDLAARARAHLASEREPELDRIVMARSAGELGAETPDCVKRAIEALTAN